MVVQVMPSPTLENTGCIVVHRAGAPWSDSVQPSLLYVIDLLKGALEASTAWYQHSCSIWGKGGTA